MKPMKPLHARYHKYICTIVDVHDENSCDAIQKALRNYTPQKHAKRGRVFHHKDLPTTQVISYILRVSPNFEKAGMANREQMWRRIQ